jgi:cytochrome P450
MAADSLTAPALDAPGDRGRHRPGWREDARSYVYWGVGHGLPRLIMRAAARRGDLQGRLILASPSGDQVWELLEEARGAGPLLPSRLSYLTVDHAAVKEVLASPDFRSGMPARADSQLGRLLARTAPRVSHPLEPPSLLVTEPPDHTRYRKLVTRVFTVRAVERLRVRTEAIAGELLDALDPRAPNDLVSSYCALLPVTVISEILGVPPAQRNLVLELGSRAAPSLDFGLSLRQFRTVTAGLRDFAGWLDTHIEELRRHPGEDLLSQLIEARDEEGALNDRELKSTAGLVLVAGFETTVNLLGNAIALLHQNPGQLDRLRAESGLWPNAVDEALRLDPPVLLTGRVCTRTTSIAGVEVPEGAHVVAILAGANRDPQVFAHPERFDVTRENAREHVSFSGGRHYCLGASLARMEGEVGLRALAERFPAMRLLPEARRRPTRILRGYDSLPALLRPLFEAADELGGQSAGQHVAVRAKRLAVLVLALGREDDEDPAAVIVAVAPLHQTVPFQAVRETGQGALAQVHGVGEALRPEGVVGLAGQVVEHLEVAHA